MTPQWSIHNNIYTGIMSPSQLICYCVPTSKQCIQSDGRMSPVVIILRHDSIQAYGVNTFLNADGFRSEFTGWVRDVSKNATAALVASEAWGVVVDEEDAPGRIQDLESGRARPIHQNREKEQIVVFVVEWRGLSHQTVGWYSWKARAGGKHIVFGQTRISEQPASSLIPIHSFLGHEE